MGFKRCNGKGKGEGNDSAKIERMFSTSLIAAFVVEARCSLLPTFFVTTNVPPFELLDTQESCGQYKGAESKVSGWVREGPEEERKSRKKGAQRQRKGVAYQMEWR